MLPEINFKTLHIVRKEEKYMCKWDGLEVFTEGMANRN
jgi:hypothetical protein